MKFYRVNNIFKRHLYNSKSIRHDFIKYFEREHNHKFVKSSPVVPFCDPTLAFVNAGMNQFKNVFLNKHTPNYTRVTNSQKCIRVGGKHNDLQAVGLDSYHHTFFEMLGNWSFGDYFKKDACQMAWRLLTDVYKIDQRRLYVTYFGGNSNLNLPPDLECKEIWRSLGLAEDRILPFDMKDNFWEMGTTGPCGGCSEIHVDHLPYSQGVNRSDIVNAGHADLTELWNLVFIEYDRKADGSITPLPSKHVDTGMGFERLVAILQNKTSNYDTDLFAPIFERTAKVCKTNSYGGSFNPSAPGFQLDTDYRILADHCRMITACLSDGMFPDQNYKLRRILRRAIMIGEKSFGNPKLLHEIVPVVVQILGDTYPEMAVNLEKSQHIISHEEDLFQYLRKNVSAELRSILAENPSLDEQDIVQYPGFVAAFKELESLKAAQKLAHTDDMDRFLFKLQDTYGLDEDGVAKILEFGKVVLDDDLETRLRSVKQQFRFQTDTSTPGASQSLPSILSTFLEQIPKTNDQYKYEYKYNEKKQIYQVPEIETEIRMLIVDNKICKSTKGVSGIECHIVTDKSTFYTESGGQESDEGSLVFVSRPEQTFTVQTVQELDGTIIHSGILEESDSEIKVGDKVRMSVNTNRRSGNIRHHTACHLLNAAVRSVTGQPVCQKSSSVHHNRLKLELGILGKRVELAELAKIEGLVRQTINAQIPVVSTVIDANRLLELENVTLVPGEIYPETDLRLIHIAGPRLSSTELCCGTHARQTGELIDFTITSFRVTGRGSYLLNAVTGDEATQVRRIGEKMLDNVMTIKTDLAVGKQMLSDLETRTTRLRTMFQNQSENLQIPHLVKHQCLDILGEISRDIKKSSRESLRDMVEIEMNHLLQQQKGQLTHIVHFLETSSLMESVPLQKATKCCPHHPVLVLSVTDGVLKGRCCIPKHLITETFTAEKWLGIVGEEFAAQVAPPKGQNAAEVCNLKAKKVNNADYEEHLEIAIEKANDFAELHLGSMKDRSNRCN